MPTGFKKSLLGFNCEEVISYIEKAHKNFSLKEQNLNNEISSLKSELTKSKADNFVLSQENDNLKKQLEDLMAKHAEIERLSENIGKLYLVAQTNAKTVMDNAAKNLEIAQAEIDKNMEFADNAQSSFGSIKENLVKSTYDFVSEVDSLIQSLEDSKNQIESNNLSSESAKEEFESIFENITK